MKSWIFLFALVLSAHAAPPPLRDEISLNGNWPVGGAVPVYAGIAGLDDVRYEREVVVPEAWRDRLVRIEFGAVNFIADVFVDGEHLMTHVGGWTPFGVDVTSRVQPGRAFRLAVRVRGPGHPPITDDNGAVAWPVGGWRKRGGIADDVWLRAYGRIHVSDAFVRTSWSRRRLEVDYTVSNTHASPQIVVLRAEVRRESDGAVVLPLPAPPLRLAAGEIRTVTVAAAWQNPDLYWPDNPVLHLLETRLENETGAVVDQECRRFGFREIAIQGNQFFWNGVRINLYGDYQAFGDPWYVDSDRHHAPDTWPATVERIKAMNIRMLRWHHNPVPRYLLDVADEKGLLICSEAANYGRDFHRQTDQKVYLENALKTIEPWIRAERNHPSIYLWNATNEMTHSFTGPFRPAELRALGREIERLDPTRPVGYDGDTGRSNAALEENPSWDALMLNRIKDAPLVDYHYPEGYNREPVGSIYGWAHLVFPDRPTGAGELLHTKSPDQNIQLIMERNTWWLGVWLRGLRRTDWTNVKPACWWFTDGDLASADPAQRQRTLNLRNALAPVALFDRDYDDLGIAPFVSGITPGGELPILAGGSVAERTLILYNDEFAGREITVRVTVRVGDQVRAQGEGRFDVALGSHREISCRFHVPRDVSGFSVELQTAKQGETRFEETRSYRVKTSVAQPPKDAPPTGVVTLR